MRTLFFAGRPAPLAGFAFLARITATFLLGFILPRLVGLESFGYYRVFALFLVYVGLSHLGFFDGVQAFMTKAAERITPGKPLSWAAIVLCIEILVAFFLLAVAFFFFEGGMRAVFFALSAMVFPELTGRYLDNLQTAVNKQNEDTPYRLFFNLLVIGIVAAVWAFSIDDHRLFLGMLVASAYLVMFTRLFGYRRLVFKRGSTSGESDPGIRRLFQKGLPVLVAYSLPLLFVAFSMHAVFIHGSLEMMAIHGFAANMLVFAAVSVATAAKRLEQGTESLFMRAEKAGLSLFKGTVTLFTLVGAVCYYALLWTVPRYLPAFEPSLPLWRIFLGLLVFNCTIGTAHFLYCRFKEKESFYIATGLLFLLATSLAGVLVMRIYADLTLLALVLFFGFLSWYLVLEVALAWKEKTPWRKNNLFVFGGLVLYIMVTALFDHVLAAFLYGGIIIGLYLFYYREELKDLKTYMGFFKEKN